MAVPSKMSAPACSRHWLAVFAALVLSSSMYAVAQVPQAPKSAASDVKRGEPAPPPRSVDGRYGIQVLASTVDVHAEAARGSAVLAQLQQGARLEADQRRGNWYRIHLADGRSGWIDYAVGKANPNFAVDANPGIARGLPGSEAGAPRAPVDAQPEAARAPAPEALPDDRIPWAGRSRQSSPPSTPAKCPRRRRCCRGKRCRCPIAGA